MKITAVYADPRTMNDVELLDYSVLYGQVTLKARNLFIGSLPEVASRGLYRKKGFESVFHYAQMTGGVSEEQVKTVLSLWRQFANFPHLISLLVTGRASINKLVRVASVASSENEEFWAGQIQLLSNRAIETLVRDYKHTSISSRATDSLFDNNNTAEQKSTSQTQARNPANSLHVQKVLQQKNEAVKQSHNQLQLDEDIRNALGALQQKGINVNAELREFLTQRQKKITQAKDELAAQEDKKAQNGNTSRYIPAAIKEVIAKEYGTCCAQPRCTKQSKEIHHTAPFSMSKSHNPYFLAPLCSEHHKIAHAIDVKVSEKRSTSLQ